jgi:hypothetical protein
MTSLAEISYVNYLNGLIAGKYMWRKNMNQSGGGQGSQGGSNNPAQNPGGGRTPATQPNSPDKDSKPSENQPSHQGNRPSTSQPGSPQQDRENK